MKNNTVTAEQIETIFNNSTMIIEKHFDKCTVVILRLPNGFVLVESSSCVDPENYDEQIGVDICVERLKDRVWELEGYKLQNELKGE